MLTILLLLILLPFHLNALDYPYNMWLNGDSNVLPTVKSWIICSFMSFSWIYIVDGQCWNLLYPNSKCVLSEDRIHTTSYSVVSSCQNYCLYNGLNVASYTTSISQSECVCQSSCLAVPGEYYVYVYGTCPTRQPTPKPTTKPTTKPSYPTRTPTYNPSMAPTQPPSISPSIAPTQPPSIYPSNNPTVNPSNYPTADPSIDPSFDPSIDPSFDPTTNYPTSMPTTNYPPTSLSTIYSSINSEWIIKEEGLNCGDGYTDLDTTSSYLNIYCRRCNDDEAGINGKCFKCGTLEEANHSRTDCEFFHPWWLYLLETITGLLCIGGLFCAMYKKLCADSKSLEYKDNTSESVEYHITNIHHVKPTQLELMNKTE